jgi:hypothetical protein
VYFCSAFVDATTLVLDIGLLAVGLDIVAALLVDTAFMPEGALTGTMTFLCTPFISTLTIWYN